MSIALKVNHKDTQLHPPIAAFSPLMCPSYRDQQCCPPPPLFSAAPATGNISKFGKMSECVIKASVGSHAARYSPDCKQANKSLHAQS